MNIDNKVWHISDSPKQIWAKKFARIFIEQQKENVDTIFVENFGLQNGMSKEDYAEYEFAEFKLKCASFGLNMECSIQSYDLSDELFYFCLGKPTERALFEAIFKWDHVTLKASGNNYPLKVEPKMQFIYHQYDNTNYKKRRINLSPLNKNFGQLKKVFTQSATEETQLINNQMEPHLGGKFFSFTYSRPNEKSETYIDNIRLFTDMGVHKLKAVMRGEDHPIFTSNLHPIVTEKSVQIGELVFPVILYVILENGKEYFYKYPTEKIWHFDSSIHQVCMTDGLSFDWIVYRSPPF